MSGSIGILDLFTRQKALWRKARRGEKTPQGRPVWDAPVMIRCRITTGKEVIGDLAGLGIHADCVVMTRRRVEIDDLIIYEGIAYKMQNYGQIPWLGGQYMGRFLFGDRYAPAEDL